MGPHIWGPVWNPLHVTDPEAIPLTIGGESVACPLGVGVGIPALPLTENVVYPGYVMIPNDTQEDQSSEYSRLGYLLTSSSVQI